MSSVPTVGSPKASHQIIEGKEGSRLIIKVMVPSRVFVPQTLDRGVEHIQAKEVTNATSNTEIEEDIETDRRSIIDEQEKLDSDEHTEIRTYHEENSIHIEKKAAGCTEAFVGGVVLFQVALKVFNIATSIFRGTMISTFFVVVVFLALYYLYKAVIRLIEQGYDYNHNGSDFYPYTWKNIQAQFVQCFSN